MNPLPTEKTVASLPSGGEAARLLGLALEPAAGPETSGVRIGPYKLLQKIGEGGFGVVWMAEQAEPIRRQVAVKILKAGMDSEEIIARFEAERQALALMEHPNIARVFDAGTTDSGRPYFAMELVRGIAITRYCDENRLSAGARLELFITVCQAVQHAHQKGVIHRDLKPSNLLVTLHDGVPVPVIIDFGIAKATSARLTEKTLFTRFHAFMGTPAYTSPEQMEMSGLDVDTRSDIYSLGVLLYELLTGRPPFDADALARDGLDAMRRLIREVDPPRPSTRLDTLSQADCTSLAQQRGTDSARLLLLLRGDLDWIVMRCLEKDRTRRYDTAAALAADVQRHLANEPVAARPPSTAYRVQKFYRRHRLGVLAATAVAVAILAALGMTFVLLVRERAARERESTLRAEADAKAEQARVAGQKSAQVAQFMTAMLAGVGPSVARGRDTTMLREILDATAQKLDTELAGQPAVAADLRDTLGGVYRDLGHFAVAEKLLREAVAARRTLNGPDSAELAGSLELHAKLLTYLGQPGAKAELLEALAIRRRLVGEKHPLFVRSLAQLSHLSPSEFASFQEWEALRRQVLAARIEILGPEHEDVAESYFGLGSVARSRNDLPESARWYRQALDLRRKVLPPDHPELIASLSNLAFALNDDGQWPEAEKYFREALQLAIKVRPEHPQLTTTLLLLAGAQPPVIRDDALVALARATVAVQRERLGPTAPSMAVSMLALAMLLEGQPETAGEARTLTREAGAVLELSRNSPGTMSAMTLSDMSMCASKRIWGGAPAQALALAEQTTLFARAGVGPPLATLPSPLVQCALVHFYTGRPADAIPFWEEAIPLLQKISPLPAPTLGNLSLLGAAHRETGRLAEAERTMRDGLAFLKQRLGNTGVPDPSVATVYCELGLTLNAQARFAEAEGYLRQSLENHDRTTREKAREYRTRLWQQMRPRAEAESGLGEALAGQGKFAEAEPLLVQAFAGLEAQRDTLAGDRGKLLREAAGRLAAFYAVWGKPDQAAKWRAVQP